MNVIVIQ